MAIDTTSEGLSFELKRSLELQHVYLGDAYWEAIRRFHGPAHRTIDGPSDTDFENHAHAWLSNFLPALSSGNPRVRAKTPRGGPAAAFAKATELAVNRNFELTDVKRTIEQLATDWAFKYCVAITTPVPVKGTRGSDPLYRPQTRRLSLEDYVWDSIAKQHDDRRFEGHRLRRDKDSLLEEAIEHPERGWNTTAIRALTEDRTREDQRQRARQLVKRGEVEFWEIWIAEEVLDEAVDVNGNAYQPSEDEGFVGTIYTVTEQSGEFLRAPRPFWGPRDGPYTFNGYLYVPDDVVPLAPLVATAPQTEMLNAAMASAIKAIMNYKVGVGVSSQTPDLEKKINQFLDQGVFTVDALDDITKAMAKIEMGGLTPQHLTMLQTLRMLVEKSSGLTEQMQGQTSSTGTTATEASIAQMGSGNRRGGMTEKFLGGTIRPIAKKEAHYLTMDPRSRTQLPLLAEGMFVDPKTGQPIEMPVLAGGPEHGSFLDEMDIEIDPVSTRYPSEMLEAERAASWEQFLFTAAPMIPQMPYLDWGLIFSNKAEQLGNPALARTIDLPRAMLMGQIQMMMTLGPMGPVGAQTQTPPTSSQPRLGIDMKQPKPQAPVMKSSEKPTGFTGNARPGGNAGAQKGQPKKGPRMAGAGSSTK
jgi:hypothetical protein